MVLLGQIDSFNHNSDDICEYIERVDQYFYANDINDAKKKTAIYFWHSLGVTLIAFLEMC